VIDHLLTFATEAAAHTALDSLGYGTGGTSWDLSRVNPNIQIITAEAVWNNATNPPTLVTPAVVKPGWWIMISLPALDATLQGLGGAAAILDRDGAVRVWVTATALQAVSLASARIAPVFCGSQYAFGV
jgi:hypothetical protein